ncbi:MAG: hypothetical protein AB7J40_04465 [Candidatus Altimarinota bacterium]
MLRHYLPSIAALFALVLAMILVPVGGKFSQEDQRFKASTVSAQTPPNTEVVFELKLFDPTEKKQSLPNPFDFPRKAEIKSIFSTYCCFSGSVKLFLDNVLVNEQQKTLHACSRCSNDSENVTWDIPPGTIADRIEQPGAIFPGEVTFIDILGERTDTVNVNNMAKVIDRVSNLASTTGAQKVAVSSSNPEVIVWLGRVDDYLKKETTVFTDNVYACSDLNLDGRCDFLSLACNDSTDNDGDGKTDFPNDPGCESLLDNDETDAPLCSDGVDNDNDGLIDFPSDPGCTSASDGDETDPPPPPINRNISLKKSAKPTIIFQPLLGEREVLSFQTTCATCTIQTSQDPQGLLGGTAAANNGFFLIASLVDSSNNSISYTIVAVGDYAQQTKLFTENAREYASMGEQGDTQYPLGILASSINNTFFRVNVGGQFEQINTDVQVLPSFAGAVKNGSEQYYLVRGQDSSGKHHLAVVKGRHWDPSTFADTNLTPEPYFSFFSNRGDLAQCAQGFQNYPKPTELLNSLKSFQVFLELLSLCQR